MLFNFRHAFCIPMEVIKYLMLMYDHDHYNTPYVSLINERMSYLSSSKYYLHMKHTKCRHFCKHSNSIACNSITCLIFSSMPTLYSDVEMSPRENTAEDSRSRPDSGKEEPSRPRVNKITYCKVLATQNNCWQKSIYTF